MTDKKVVTFKPVLGCIAKDEITGFWGVIIAHEISVFNSDRYCVQPRELASDGKIKDAKWFDELRLIVTDPTVVVNVVPTGEFPYNMWDEVKDKMSPFKGIVVGKIAYITGCLRATVQPDTMKDGQPIEPLCYPIDQLHLIKSAKKLDEPEKHPGGPMKDPQEQKAPRMM